MRADRPWLFDGSQGWRLCHWRLWRGPSFDPDDPQQAMIYAFKCLSRAERAVFALCRFDAMTYSDIAYRLGVSAVTVERRLVRAICKMSRMLDLIERARGRRVGRLASTDQDRPDR
jgi:DNA-directed RNA polymerase specialized sigma24 family protein